MTFVSCFWCARSYLADGGIVMALNPMRVQRVQNGSSMAGGGEDKLSIVPSLKAARATSSRRLQLPTPSRLNSPLAAGGSTSDGSVGKPVGVKSNPALSATRRTSLRHLDASSGGMPSLLHCSHCWFTRQFVHMAVG